MKKVLFLNVTTHGHVNPSLGLVKELNNRGIEVVYFQVKNSVKRSKKLALITAPIIMI